MNYTVKLLLRKVRDSHVVYLRTTIAGKQVFKTTQIKVPPKFWDEANEKVKNGYLAHEQINADITQRKYDVITKITAAILNKKKISVNDLRIKENLTNIFDFSESYIKEVKNKRKEGTLESYRKHLLNLEKFNGSRNLNFEDITIEYLTNFESWLLERVSKNYTHSIFVRIRKFFNAARKKGIIDHYPFEQFEFPKYLAPGKEYLTISELKLFEDFFYITENTGFKETIVYFLFGCYTGFRISDWASFTVKDNVKGKMIRLRAAKNNEWILMPISDPMLRNLVRMVEIKLNIREQTLNNNLKSIAKKLSINKKLSSHCARHTFAITICAELGLSSETCAELMGITIQTCVENYYKVTQSKITKETIAAWGVLK